MNKEINKFTHKELVEIGYRWILKNGSVGVAFKELNTNASNGEYPDVIGFGSHGFSFMMECKCSREDFLRDKLKMFRKNPEQGMGTRRYYVCPENLIRVDDLPKGWGLVYVYPNGKARCVHKPMASQWGHYEHQKNIKAEHGLMYSALRRLFIKGHIKCIYDKEYNKSSTPNELIELNSTL